MGCFFIFDSFETGIPRQISDANFFQKRVLIDVTLGRLNTETNVWDSDIDFRILIFFYFYLDLDFLFEFISKLAIETNERRMKT